MGTVYIAQVQAVIQIFNWQGTMRKSEKGDNSAKYAQNFIKS